MVLMLDTLAQRYGCLPSEILAKGDTLDINIMTRAIAWHNERQIRAEQGLTMPHNHGYSEDQLLAMIEKVK